MYIRRDNDRGVATLIPANRGERRLMTNAIGIIQSCGGRLDYGGRIGTDEDPVQAIILHAGGRSKRVTQVSNGGRFKVTKSIRLGGVKLVLRGTTAADQQHIFPLRDACYYGSGGFDLVRALRGGGAVITAKRCKCCAGPMIDMASCEWEVCGTCALICEHNYVRGAVHGGGVDIGIGFFCDKCGRGKPKEKGVPLSLDMHHMAVQAELGVHVVEAPTMKAATAEVVRRICAPSPPNN